MHKGRLEAFSDGVIAIIITIMVLEMKVPHGTDWAALRGEHESSGASSSAQALAGVGETVLPSGEVLASSSQLTGGGEATFSGSGRSHSRTTSTIHGATEGAIEFSIARHARSEFAAREPWWRHHADAGADHASPEAAGVVEDVSIPGGVHGVEAPGDPDLPQGHFVLKVPHSPAVILRAPRVDTPKLSERRRRENLTRVYAQACYSTPDQIDAEEQRRNAKLLATLEPHPVLEDGDPSPPRGRRRLINGKVPR